MLKRFSWQDFADSMGFRRKPPVPDEPVRGAAIDPHRLNPALAGGHQPKPLRFQPNRLEGLSEALIRSHWENNYQAAVKALNLIEARIAAALTDPDLPSAVYGALKREELSRTGSVILHEIYFDGLGGNGEASGAVKEALIRTYGSLEAWETEFRRTAMSLAGGSGWVVLAYNMNFHALRNYWAADYMHGAIGGLPLLALDMYEHSFHLDFGAAAAKYIDAFFRNIDWEVVDRRYAKALATAKL